MNEKPIVSPLQNVPDLSQETQESIATRVANCNKAIEEVLIKYGCTLQVQQGVGIVPLKLK